MPKAIFELGKAKNHEKQHGSAFQQSQPWPTRNSRWPHRRERSRALGVTTTSFDLVIAWGAVIAGIPLAFYLGFAFPDDDYWRTAATSLGAFFLASYGIELCSHFGYCQAGERILDSTLPLFSFPMYWVVVYLGIRLKRARNSEDS